MLTGLSCVLSTYWFTLQNSTCSKICNVLSLHRQKIWWPVTCYNHDKITSLKELCGLDFSPDGLSLTIFIQITKRSCAYSVHSLVYRPTCRHLYSAWQSGHHHDHHSCCQWLLAWHNETLHHHQTCTTETEKPQGHQGKHTSKHIFRQLLSLNFVSSLWLTIFYKIKRPSCRWQVSHKLYIWGLVKSPPLPTPMFW